MTKSELTAHKIKRAVLGLENSPAAMLSAFKRCEMLASETNLKRFIEIVWPKNRRTLTEHKGVPMINPLTKGNLKLDKSIAIFNLPAVATCPDSRQCQDTCYALRPQKRYPYVRRGRFVNLLLADFWPDFFFFLFLSFSNWTLMNPLMKFWFSAPST